MSTTPRAHAIFLLSAGRAQIARSCFRLAKRLDAGVTTIPDPAAEGSIANFMRGLEGYLRSDDEALLIDTIRQTIELRRLAGYGMAQLITMSHTYLPVIRKVFLRSEPDSKAALAAYDVVESLVLPLMIRLLHELLLTQPPPGDVDEDTARFSVMATLTEEPNPFAMLSVEDIITAEE